MKFAHVLLLSLSLASPMALAAKYEPPAEDARNPQPTEALKNFQRFEHRPVAVVPALAKKGDADTARIHLQANMAIRSIERTKVWNEASAGESPRTLVIEPIIEQVRFVTPGKRVFIGVLWGSSYVDLKLRLTDAATGQVIGEPHFYQRAGAGAAGWGMGVVDRAMLVRVTNMVDAYLRDNYAQPIETNVAIMPSDTPEQTLEKQELERRANNAVNAGG